MMDRTPPIVNKETAASTDLDSDLNNAESNKRNLSLSNAEDKAAKRAVNPGISPVSVPNTSNSILSDPNLIPPQSASTPISTDINVIELITILTNKVDEGFGEVNSRLEKAETKWLALANELQAVVKEKELLKTRVTELEQRNNSLRSRVEALESISGNAVPQVWEPTAPVETFVYLVGDLCVILNCVLWYSPSNTLCFDRCFVV